MVFGDGVGLFFGTVVEKSYLFGYALLGETVVI